MAHENAQAIGGHFTFSQLSESRYSSRFEFYAIPASDQFIFSTTTPVIVLSRNLGLFQDCAKECTGAANIYWSKGELNPTEKDDDPSGQWGSIYIYDESEFDERQKEINNIPTSAVQIMLRQKEPENVIVVERRRIIVTRSDPLSILTNALQIAEAILASIALDERTPSVALSRQCYALVMDDSPLNLAILEEKLAQLGINTVAVTSTSGAASALGSQAFDLFVLDWNVGLHTAQRLLDGLTNHPTHMNMKCVIISAEDISVDLLPPTTLNRIRRLVKPVSDALFQSTIFELIEDSRTSPDALNNSSPDAIFDYSTYLNLGLNARTIHFTKELLANFVESLEQAFQSIENQVASTAIPGIDADAHKLASMCYSAGAYALGDEFKSIDGALSSDRQVGPDVVRRRIQSMRKIFRLTECHILHFLRTLDCHLDEFT
ncbi:MAG: Hpt domain-containing protein [Proteobacteria bacterium]|nr:Hpt domain-containing protein [Pseudomonadota bacterium]